MSTAAKGKVLPSVATRTTFGPSCCCRSPPARWHRHDDPRQRHNQPLCILQRCRAAISALHLHRLLPQRPWRALARMQRLRHAARGCCRRRSAEGAWVLPPCAACRPHTSALIYEILRPKIVHTNSSTRPGLPAALQRRRVDGDGSPVSPQATPLLQSWTPSMAVG